MQQILLSKFDFGSIFVAMFNHSIAYLACSFYKMLIFFK